MDLRKFCKTYKYDIVCILLIILMFTICSYLLWGYFGSILYDCGREAYLPQLILEGKILFKDIFGMYNPLSYQINALLYLIFGINLNVLYFAGTINAFLQLLCLYFICRQFVSEKYSTGFILFIMLVVIFNSHNDTNNIFPYAFAMAYATTAMLYSALCGLLYLKYHKSVYIILSFLLLGISLANKPEFVLCAVPHILLLIYGKEKFATWIFSVSGFILPTVISYGILFLQGFTFNDFTNYISFIHNFFDTPEQKLYNQRLYGIDSWIYMLKNSLFIAILFILPKLISSLLKRNKLYIILFIVLAILLFSSFVKFAVSLSFYVSWTCIVCFWVLYWAFKNKNIPLCYLSTFAILSCSRLWFNLTCGYGLFLGLLTLSICLIYLFKYKNSKYFDTNVKKLIMVLLILFGIITYGANFYLKHRDYIKVETSDKNTVLYESKKYVVPFNNTVSWILQNTKPDDAVLVLPEGLFINYITKRPTNPKYYHLIPNHISALGEDNIVKDLSENLPNYIILNNVSYEAYGAKYICENFGFKICSVINDNYELVETYSSHHVPKYHKDPFYMKIYKLKNNQ